MPTDPTPEDALARARRGEAPEELVRDVYGADPRTTTPEDVAFARASSSPSIRRQLDETDESVEFFVSGFAFYARPWWIAWLVGSYRVDFRPDLAGMAKDGVNVKVIATPRLEHAQSVPPAVRRAMCALAEQIRRHHVELNSLPSEPLPSDDPDDAFSEEFARISFQAWTVLVCLLGSAAVVAAAMCGAFK